MQKRNASRLRLFTLLAGFTLSAHGASFVGYRIELQARQPGVFRSFEQEFDAATIGSGRYFIADSREPAIQQGVTPYPLSGVLVIPSSDTAAVAVAAVSPEPLRIRTGASVNVENDAGNTGAERVTARTSARFGDLISISGPGATVPVTFTMGWTMDLGGVVPTSIPGPALDIYDDYGTPLDIAYLDYGFGLTLSRTQGASDILFSTSYFYDETVWGETVPDGNGGWRWDYTGSIIDPDQTGDGSYTFDRSPRLPWDGSLTQQVRVTWTHTANVPTGEFLNLVGSWSGASFCWSNFCTIRYESVNSSGIGIEVPAGYTFSSSQGFRYEPLEDPPSGNEIPEPASITLALTGLAVLIRRRRRVA